MWNFKEITPPPINSFKCINKSLDIFRLHTTLEQAMRILSAQKSLNCEGALISRFIYKLKLKFRSDKGLKAIEKVHKSLHNYLNFNLIKDIKFFVHSLPKYYMLDTYLPTKQMAEYLLVRFQGFAQLLSRIITTSGEAAQLMISRMKLGHFWNVAFICLAMSSRLWCICKTILKELCNWYNLLLSARNQLEFFGKKWLPDDYTFPDNLMKWLDNYWIEEKPRIVKKLTNIPIFSLLDSDDEDDDVQFCYQYKNDDFVIINDETHDDDDIQFVQEFINLTKKRKVFDDIIALDDTDKSVINLDCTDKSIINLDITEDSVKDTDQSKLIVINDNVEMDDSVICSEKQVITNRITGTSGVDPSNYISTEDLDVGQVIPRHLMKPQVQTPKTKNQNKKLKQKKKNMNTVNTQPTDKFQDRINELKNISSLKKLKKFVHIECKARKKRVNTCFTKNINLYQWNIILDNVMKIKNNFEIAKKLLLESVKSSS